MKRLIRKSLATTALVVVLSFALIFSAFAGSFNHLADELSDLGLFRGTELGYELDREPNRGESLVMLVRLLGLEEDALAGGYEHPFTDVPAWVSPYVAFAYEKGLTTGLTETSFGFNSFCTAQMYVTFVLRALGYDDSAGDFTYAGAVEFGQSIGIVDGFLAGGKFTRDEMVAISHLALAAAPKDSEYGSLLEKLVSDGAVKEAAAAPVLSRFALFNEFMSVGTELIDETNFDMSITMDIDMGPMGAGSASMDLSMIIDDADITAAIVLEATIAGEEIEAQIYLADGFLYINIDGEKAKVDIGLADVEDMLAMADMNMMAFSPSYLFKDVKKSTEGAYTLYTATLADSFMDIAMGMTNDMLDSVGLDSSELMGFDGMKIDIPTLIYYADADGALKRMIMSMSMAMDLGVLGAMSISVDLDMVINAVGDAVTVKLPDDLDKYELTEAGLPGF